MPAWAGRYAQARVATTLATYGTVCHLCRLPGATTADHLIPRSRGGDDSIENLRPAHKLCNERRGNRSIIWFRRRYAKHLVEPQLRRDHRQLFKLDAPGHPAPARPFFPGSNKTGAATTPRITPETLAFFTDRTRS